MQARNEKFKNLNEIKTIQQKLTKVINSSRETLYEDDEIFIKNMETNNLAGDDINRYRLWEWPQGVSLFGFWKLFENTKDKKFLDIITHFYAQQFQTGLPSKNINTTAPMLTMAYLYEHNCNTYKEVCTDWANDGENLPRTRRISTSDIRYLNDNEL